MNNTTKVKNMKKFATNIVCVLRKGGFEAYFVGGCVRDMIMGNEPFDYDIATSARPEDVKKLFKRTVPVGVQFGVMIVILDETEFQVATFRSDGEYLDGRHPKDVHFSTVEEDVKRRDFTINGLLYDPITDEIKDFVGGREDIKKKIIRTIGNPNERFSEDKLRILRAIRFANRFNFQVEKKTLEAIRTFVPLLEEISQERIRDELVKMMTGPNPYGAFELMDKVGLLDGILPEVTKLKGCEQNPKFHPEGDVFVHTMLMMKQLII